MKTVDGGGGTGGGGRVVLAIGVVSADVSLTYEMLSLVEVEFIAVLLLACVVLSAASMVFSVVVVLLADVASYLADGLCWRDVLRELLGVECRWDVLVALTRTGLHNRPHGRT